MPPSPPPYFPANPLFKDDVTVILLLGASFMVGDQKWGCIEKIFVEANIDVVIRYLNGNRV